MGQSTDGEISFGYIFEEGFEFPWDEKWDDIEDWWRDVNGFIPTFYPYDDRGEYKAGVTSEHIDAYFDEKHEWDKNNYPVPVQLVNYCSGECPMYILAVPGSVVTANRGYPKVINLVILISANEQKSALLDFCLKYEIDIKDQEEPLWRVSSCWN